MRDKPHDIKKIYIVLRRERKTIRDKSYEIKKIYIVMRRERKAMHR